jgi:hypothetical protein
MGMDRLCKYRYKGDRCAHGMIDSAACVGEGSCRHADKVTRKTYQDDCSKEHWYGLYCAKYRRFFCAGKENCGSAQDYFVTMVNAHTRAE